MVERSHDWRDWITSNVTGRNLRKSCCYQHWGVVAPRDPHNTNHPEIVIRGQPINLEKHTRSSCNKDLTPCQVIRSGNRSWGRSAIENVTFCCYPRSLFFRGRSFSSSVLLLVDFKEPVNLLIDLSFEFCRVKTLIKLG